jgi:MFS family permease
MRFFEATERVVLTAWVGGMWAIGYLAAPVLFNVLDDRRMAGELAGPMFKIMAIVGLVCGAVLLASALKRHGATWFRTWRVWTLVAMLVLVAISLFVLQPMLQELKEQGLVEGSEQIRRFGMLHGVSWILYLFTSVGGLALVACGLVPRPATST